MKNKYIKIALLSGFLVGSQVFAVNTIDTSIVTDNVTQISEVKALHVVKDATQQDYMKIISKKSGSTGNGDILRYRNDAQTNETYQCKRVNTLSMVEIVCGRDAVTNAFVNTINWHFANEGFAAEQIGTLLGERIVHLQLGKTSENWTLSGGIDGQEAVAQVVSFTPTVADNYKYYRISINSAEYSISVNKNTTINEIVEAFYNEMHNDSSVTCTEDDTKLTCTAYTAGDSFSYITSVVNRDETADERDARLLEEARLAKEAWQNQLTVVTNSLTTANTAQANATTIVNGNDSLPSKLISINQSKQANGLFLLETQKLNGLKSDNPADNTIINNFYQQYQTLNTATNALMTNYTEQKRIADLKGVAWQNQLTVVTSSVTAANTAQANATTIMGNNYNSFPSKLASINQSKQANATLLSEIQKLDGVKRTNADSVTITNFNQQYQTLNTATNALMTNYTEQKRIADLEEAAWQNQLTVVTSSLTAANTAQANATITMGNNYNSLPSKLASINQSKQANATLLSEIQKLDGLKRTDADSVTVTSYDQQYQILNTATNTLMASYEEQKRIADLKETTWQNQLTVVTNSVTAANTAQANATTIMGNNYNSLPSKLASINQSKQANATLLSEIQKLDGLKRTNADSVTITNFNQQYQTLNTATSALMANYEEQKRIADLETTWQNQLTVVTNSVTAANTAQANATITMGNNYNSLPSKLASINQSKQANATLLSEIQKLDGLKRTDADSVTVTSFDQQYQTLNTATSALMANYEEQKRIAGLEATWQNQLTVVTNSVTAANTAQANATITMGNNYNSLPSKLASINQSKQANATLLSEIQKLDGLKRTDADSVTVTSFDQQYQTLNTATSALMANYTEQKRIADLEVAWQSQLTVVTSSLTTANTTRANATIAISNNHYSLPSKLLLINQLKQANGVLLEEIRKLSGLKRTDADNATVEDFEQQQQTLTMAVNALMVSYEGQKNAADKATMLTGHWKAPVIKGLDYATATHSSVTDENGAFKCQSGENVTFSIASLVLTSIPCTEILNTKTTNNISLNATSSDGFKDWKDETNKQMLITKVLFGLFGKNIKTAFAQEDEALKFITVELTEAQKSNTMNRSLDANDLNLLVQNILGITEPVVLPTTEQAENMVTSGWQASKVFDGAISNDDSTDTGASTKSSGGGCVYNPNAPARFDMGFILLMVLSAYYLIRRKRRFV
jgi:hypothetical protein